MVKVKLTNMTRTWNKEKSLSPDRNRTHDLLNHRVGALSTDLRELMESKVIQLSSYVTSVLHTVSITTVELIE